MKYKFGVKLLRLCLQVKGLSFVYRQHGCKLILRLKQKTQNSLYTRSAIMMPLNEVLLCFSRFILELYFSNG